MSASNQSFCKDWTSPRTHQVYKGCGEPITWMKLPDGRNVAYSMKDGNWIEHKLICEARKQTALEIRPQEPEPNIGASQPREIAVMQSDRLNEIGHQVSELRKEQLRAFYQLQAIARKLDVKIPPQEEIEDQ